MSGQLDHVLCEIVQSERDYVDNLQVIADELVSPLLRATWVTEEEVSTLFSSFGKIQSLNVELSKKLSEAQQAPSPAAAVANAFLELAPYLKVYSTYIVNVNDALATADDLHARPEWPAFLEPRRLAMKRLDLKDYLIMPMQRVCKYTLLLRQLERVSAGDDLDVVVQARTTVEDIVNEINQRKEEHDARARTFELRDQMEKLPEVLESRLCNIRHSVLVHEGLTDTDKYYFLFSTDLVICKRKKIRRLSQAWTGGKKKKAPIWTYLDHLNLEALLFREEGSVSVELVVQRRRVMMTLPDTAARVSFVNMLSEAITGYAAKPPRRRGSQTARCSSREFELLGASDEGEGVMLKRSISMAFSSHEDEPKKDKEAVVKEKRRRRILSIGGLRSKSSNDLPPKKPVVKEGDEQHVQAILAGLQKRASPQRSVRDVSSSIASGGSARMRKRSVSSPNAPDFSGTSAVRAALEADKRDLKMAMHVAQARYDELTAHYLEVSRALSNSAMSPARLEMLTKTSREILGEGEGEGEALLSSSSAPNSARSTTDPEPPATVPILDLRERRRLPGVILYRVKQPGHQLRSPRKPNRQSRKAAVAVTTRTINRLKEELRIAEEEREIAINALSGSGGYSSGDDDFPDTSIRPSASAYETL